MDTREVHVAASDIGVIKTKTISWKNDVDVGALGSYMRPYSPHNTYQGYHVLVEYPNRYSAAQQHNITTLRLLLANRDAITGSKIDVRRWLQAYEDNVHKTQRD